MQVGVYDDGQVCQFDGCLETDLLPAVCTNCKRTFCSQHILSSSHHCQCVPDARLPHCPICNAVVLAAPGQSIDDAVSRHIDRGCAPTEAAGSGAPFSSGARPLFNPENPWLVGAGGRGSSASGGGSGSGGHRLGSSSAAPVPPYRRPPTASSAGQGARRPSSRSGVTNSAGRPSSTAGASAGTYSSLSALLSLKPGNALRNAVGRPLGVAVEKSTEAWVPLVYTLVSKEDFMDLLGDTPTLPLPPPKQGLTEEVTVSAGAGLSATEQQASKPRPPSSSSTAAAGAAYLAIPPLYVYARRTHSLGKVLDTTVQEIRLHHSAFSAATAASTSLSPRYLFLVPQVPPEGATVDMFPPQPLSGLVGKTVWTGPTISGSSSSSSAAAAAAQDSRERKSAGAASSSQAVVFLSNRDRLPPELLTIMRQQRRLATSSSCLAM